MGFQQLLVLLLFVALFQTSNSSPTLERRIRDDIDDPDGYVKELEEKFKGIYWREAWNTCSQREFFLLADTAEMVTQFISPAQNDNKPDRDTAGWTRFFAGNDVTYEWPDPKRGSPRGYENILNALEQVRNFPVEGKVSKKDPNRPRKVSRSDRIIFTCKPPPRWITKCENEKVGASTIFHEYGEPEDANLVIFCPPFLNDYDITKDPSQSKAKWSLSDRTWKSKGKDITELEALVTKEHIMLHEFFHCDAALGLPTRIVDLKQQKFPNGEVMPLVYGAEYCAKFAYMNIKYARTKDTTAINPMVAQNADNYAWMFTFNWFKKYWGWTSKGYYYWDDNSKRDISDLGSDDAFDVDGNGTLTGSTGISVEEMNNSPSLPNCQQVGDEPDDIECAYLGGNSIDEWASNHPSFTMTSTPLTAPTVSVESYMTTTLATTSSASFFCYNYQNPGVTTGCECDGLDGVYPQMPSTSGQISYDPCGWTTKPPSASSTSAQTANVTAVDGTISYCTDAVRADADVNDVYSCAVTATPIATDGAIASQYSDSRSSTAAAEAAVQSIESAALKVSGDVAIALKEVTTQSGGQAQYNYWAVQQFKNSDGDFCSGDLDVYKASDLPQSFGGNGYIGSIEADSVPYPPSFNFTSDLFRGMDDMGGSVSSLGGWPCYYEGSSDAPGTISCTGWKNITCTDNLKDGNQEVGCGFNDSYDAKTTYFPKVFCEFEESDKLTEHDLLNQ